MRALFLLLWIFLAGLLPASAEILEIEYEGFTVWVDCDRRGPVLFHYVAEADSGSFGRHANYFIDSQVPVRCQSTSRATFQSVLRANNIVGVFFDVGHQAPANHFDGSVTAIRETNFWTNLLPQTLSMNRGAWQETEHIIECIRDQVPLEVWGGPIWGSNFHDDYFVASHGIQTPSAFWKVVIRTDDNEAMAWVIPNGLAPTSSLDMWIESVEMVEKLTGRTFDAVNKDTVPESSWRRTPGCSIS